MTRLKDLIIREKPQYLVFLGLSLGVLGLTGISYFFDPLLFQRYLGELNPAIACILTIFLGVVLLSFLLSRGWFAIYRKESLNGLVRSSVLAALFGLVIILVDLKIVFPADLNIPFPGSLLFYPAIGFFVEIVFHVLPLSILLIALTCFKTSHENIIWVCIVIVALLEPVFQTMTLDPAHHYPLWAVIYVWLHVFLINLVQLVVFKRYDFVSMYSFRLVYYLIWHIGWGYFRLKILF